MTAALQHAALEVVDAYLDRLDPRYLAEGVTLELPGRRRPVIGRAAVAALVHDVRHRFFTDTDATVEHTRMVAGHVAVELTFIGLPVSGRWPIPVTDQHVTVRATAVVDTAGGEITAVAVSYDATLLRHDLLDITAVASTRSG